jgi:hypothetical protein
MKTLLTLALAVLFVGCAATEKKTLATASAATVPASEDQALLGSRRAEAMVSGWDEETRTQFLRNPSPYVAVRTLPLTPEQVSASGRPDAATLVPVVLWDVKTEKMVGTDCYLCGSLPAAGESARFGPHTARYLSPL